MKDIMIWDSSISDPSNITILSELASGVTNSSGQVQLPDIGYGTKVIEVEETPSTKKYFESVLIDSDSKQIAVTPTYTVIITTNKGATVVFTDSDGIVTNAEAANGTITINKVPAGEYSINVTLDGYTPVNITGTIEQTTDTTLNLDYTLNRLPKLVQVTTVPDGFYTLDTSYKYLSVLVVGKGYRAESTPTGGGSGTVAYKKNLLVADMKNVTIEEDRSGPGTVNTGTMFMWDSINIADRFVIIAPNATSINGGAIPQYMKNSVDILDELDGYGSNSGSNSYTKGGGGSSADGTSGVGGTGGDGTFGFGGNGTSVSKGTIIPLSSIFGGTGAGGSSYNIGDYPYQGSGGGYSSGDSLGPNYGGGANYRFGHATSVPSGGSTDSVPAWIICLYYHDTEL